MRVTHLRHIVPLTLCILVVVAQAEVRPISFQCHNVDMYKKRTASSDSWLATIRGALTSAIQSMFGATDDQTFDSDEERNAFRPYFSNVMDGSECAPYVGKGPVTNLNSSEAILDAATMAPLNTFSFTRKDVTQLHFFSGSDEVIEELKTEGIISKGKDNNGKAVLQKKNTVLLIVPGGAYQAISRYDTQIFPFEVLDRAKKSVKAAEKKSMSFLPVVLQYRLTPVSPYSPAEDISFAIRLLARYRSHAKVNFMKSAMFQYLIDPDAVGAESEMENSTTVLNPASLGLEENFSIVIVGFSAGGHAAATYAAKSSLIPIQAVILVFPVISMEDPNIYHQRSTINLLGFDIKSVYPRTDGNDLLTNKPETNKINSSAAVDDNEDSKTVRETHALAANFSINHFPNNFPRCVYITHSRDDKVVPVKHSKLMFDALVKHRTKHNLFLRSGKGKGIGMYRMKGGGSAYGVFGSNKTHFEDKYDVALQVYPSGPHGRWSNQIDKPLLSNWWGDVENWLRYKRSRGKCLY